MKTPLLLGMSLLCLIFAGMTRSQDGVGEGRNYVDGVIRQLSHSDPKVRLRAAKTLEDIAFGIRATQGQLMHMVERDFEPEVRRQAARTLASIGPTANMSVPALIKALDDEKNNDDVREAVIGAIAATAPFSKQAIPKLIKLARHKEPVIRRRAIGALRAFGPDAKDAVPTLMASLSDPDPGIPGKEPGVKVQAASALQAIGRDAQAAVDVLLKIQESGDVELKQFALRALTKIIPDDPKLIPYLVQFLKNKETPDLRASAALALGILGGHAKEAVPDLIDALRAKDVGNQAQTHRIKAAAIFALGEIGPAARAALPALGELVSGSDEELRSFAEAAMQKIQPRKS